MAVTIDDVRHIASLARVGVTQDRARVLVAELNTILEHMNVLSRVDTAAVEPLAAIGLDNAPLRGDSGPCVALERPLAEFAPSIRDGFFLVPRLSTHEDDDA
jgi:aspartyl-tRNA(Asn)/glutamyl-tRNA(Gln) amidotransferase subunit C